MLQMPGEIPAAFVLSPDYLEVSLSHTEEHHSLWAQSTSQCFTQPTTPWTLTSKQGGKLCWKACWAEVKTDTALSSSTSLSSLYHTGQSWWSDVTDRSKSIHLHRSFPTTFMCTGTCSWRTHCMAFLTQKQGWLPAVPYIAPRPCLKGQTLSSRNFPALH